MATTEGVEYAQAVAAGMQRFTGRRGGEDKTYLKLDMVTDGWYASALHTSHSYLFLSNEFEGEMVLCCARLGAPPLHCAAAYL